MHIIFCTINWGPVCHHSRFLQHDLPRTRRPKARSTWAIFWIISNDGKRKIDLCCRIWILKCHANIEWKWWKLKVYIVFTLWRSYVLAEFQLYLIRYVVFSCASVKLGIIVNFFLLEIMKTWTDYSLNILSFHSCHCDHAAIKITGDLWSRPPFISARELLAPAHRQYIEIHLIGIW